MTILYSLLGGMAGLMALIGLIVLIAVLCGAVGMDGLFSLTQARGTLTCWHCGEQTTAGLRHCQHCDGELQ